MDQTEEYRMLQGAEPQTFIQMLAVLKQGGSLEFFNEKVTFTAMLTTIYTRAYDEAQRMLRSGESKSTILAFLATAAEKAGGDDSVASIMVLDEKGLLRNGAAPKLPPDYLKAIDGIKPSPNLGTCAATAATGKVTITKSFNADNKWAELRHLPTALGFVGAWSMPIKTRDNKVLGTFGTYFRTQRGPTEEELKGTAILATAAAMVLENLTQVNVSSM